MRRFLFAFLLLHFFLENAVCQAPPTSINDSLVQVLQEMRVSLLDSLPDPQNLSDEECQNWAFRFAEQAAILKNQFATELRYVSYARENTQERLADLKAIKTAPDSVVAPVQAAFLQARQAEKAWKELANRAEKTSENATRIARVPIKNMRLALPQLEIDLRKLLDDADRVSRKLKGEAIANAPEKPAKQTPIRSKSNKTADDFAVYSQSTDPVFNPPAPPCQLAVQGRDEFTGETRFELKPELLFTFTNDFMKNYLKDKPHILCETHLSAMTNGARFLNLSFKINENNAKKSFGGFNRNNQLILKFIDGSVATLYNARSDEGITDELGGFTLFRASYLLDDRAIINSIKKKELDKIRVAWNTGFEDYEIFSIDLLMRQCECLFK